MMLFNQSYRNDPTMAPRELSPHHVELLQKKYGITAEVALLEGFMSITPKEAQLYFGRPSFGGGLFHHQKLRLDEEVPSEKGKPQRFDSKKGEEVLPYFPKCVPDWSQEKVIVESSTKAVSVSSNLGIAAIGLGGINTGHQKGASPKRLHNTILEKIRPGDKVVICFDAGRSLNPKVFYAERKLARMVAQTGALPYIAVIPPTKDGKDQGPDDYLVRNGAEALRSVIMSALPMEEAYKTPPFPIGEQANVVEVSHRIDLMTTRAIEALADDEAVYQRAGVLVFVTKTGDIKLLTPANLRERLSRVAFWYKVDKRSQEKVPTTPPDTVVAAILDRGEWPDLRELRAVYTHPFLKPDGSIACTPGYDESTKTLLVLEQPFEIKENPTQEDAKAAAQELLEVVRDFDFIDESARSAWVALVLTLLARPAIDGAVPLFAFDAAVRGSGKSLLAEAASLIARGTRPYPITVPESSDEFRKLLVTLAMGGDSLLFLDNVKENQELGGAALETAITSGKVKDRLLGKNAEIQMDIPAVWCATGNNLAISTDIARRTLPCRLEPRVEDPESRSDFKHPHLRRWIKEERPRLLVAALTMLRAWCLSERTITGGLWGSFEEWSTLIPSVLVWCGLADPIRAHRELVSADPHKGTLATFLEALRLASSDPLTAREILSRAYGSDAHPDPDQALQDAIEALAPTRNGKRHTSQALGAALRKFKGRIAGGNSLVCEIDKKAKITKWGVNAVTPSAGIVEKAGIGGYCPPVDSESREEQGKVPEDAGIGTKGELEKIPAPLHQAPQYSPERTKVVLNTEELRRAERLAKELEAKGEPPEEAERKAFAGVLAYRKEKEDS